MSLIGPSRESVEPSGFEAQATYSRYAAYSAAPIRPTSGSVSPAPGLRTRRGTGRHRARPAAPIAARIAVAVGKSMVAAGVLLALFALFQLWGTGIVEARAQETLTSRFRTQQTLTAPHRASTIPAAMGKQSAPAGETGQTTIAPADERPAPASPPQPGEPVAVLTIPAIDVTKTVIEGTSRDLLRSGPGHYRFTPLPGQPGNAAIAGHRTTHGAPFFDIDLLQPGDEISVETAAGTFTYVVLGFDDGSGGQVGHRIVQPDDVGVITDLGDDRLTLTACHPKYSAKQRIVVTAILHTDQAAPGHPPADPGIDATLDPAHRPAGQRDEGLGTADQLAAADDLAATDQLAAADDLAAPDQLAATEGLAATDQLAAADESAAVARSLGWQPGHAGPTARWAAITALIVTAGALAGRYWRRWPAYAMTVPPFCLALFTCFTELERLLPAM